MSSAKRLRQNPYEYPSLFKPRSCSDFHLKDSLKPASVSHAGVVTQIQLSTGRWPGTAAAVLSPPADSLRQGSLHKSISNLLLMLLPENQTRASRVLHVVTVKDANHN